MSNLGEAPAGTPLRRQYINDNGRLREDFAQDFVPGSLASGSLLLNSSMTAPFAYEDDPTGSVPLLVSVAGSLWVETSKMVDIFLGIKGYWICIQRQHFNFAFQHLTFMGTQILEMPTGGSNWSVQVRVNTSDGGPFRVDLEDQLSVVVVQL